MIAQEKRLYEQALYLIGNTVESKTGRFICFYKDILIIANTPAQLQQLLDCIWK